MADWRLAKLREVQEFGGGPSPTSQQAFVVSYGETGGPRIGFYVIRPGVPDWTARQTWHLTDRGAHRVRDRWNRALMAGAQ